MLLLGKHSRRPAECEDKRCAPNWTESSVRLNWAGTSTSRKRHIGKHDAPTLATTNPQRNVCAVPSLFVTAFMISNLLLPACRNPTIWPRAKASNRAKLCVCDGRDLLLGSILDKKALVQRTGHTLEPNTASPYKCSDNSRLMIKDRQQAKKLNVPLPPRPRTQC